MTRIVLDASAALHLILGQPTAAELSTFLETADLVTSPQLFHAEVANALWKYVRHRDMDRGVATGLLEAATHLVDTFIDDHELAGEALIAAATYEHPVYDMIYAVLARRHGATVLTLDRRFRRVLVQMGLDVEPKSAEAFN